MTSVALTETSDSIPKENIKDINTKECYKAARYIKPKAYNIVKDKDKKVFLGLSQSM